MYCLTDELKNNAYPGRGILIGKSADGLYAVIAYFIMGRSENSRNRIFVETDDGIRTQAYDPQKLSDPSLVIYTPVRVFGNRTIVTNGDQTDTIYEHLQKGSSFTAALQTRTFEPDPPIYTPRISGLLRFAPEGDFTYQLAILKSMPGHPESVLRFFFEYTPAVAGIGHFLHTYLGDGNPVPSFVGEPKPVAIAEGLDSLTAQIWQNLNAENRVSLFTRFIHLSTGETSSRIINRNH